MSSPNIHLPEDRFFGPDAGQKEVAQQLYATVATLPLVCPHGHVDPHLLGDPDYSLGTPTDLFLIPDHYVFRMLYSQGVPLESLSITRRDGSPVEADHRSSWQLFAEHFFLFRGTPTGIWITHALHDVFGVEHKLGGDTAQEIYDQIADCLTRPEFRPRRLFDRFNIEVLTTTDAATDTLASHRAILESDWSATVLPTFRPDAVIAIDASGWHTHIGRLSDLSGSAIADYPSFIAALEARRAHFKAMGATATDHAVLTPYTGELSPREAEAIFQRALEGQAAAEDAARFGGHMVMEMARMSVEDGLVMQLHPGAYRNHNSLIHERFGPDTGADIPTATEYTRNLHPLLNRYGNDSRLTLILFTLDETSYSQELAPLAGHYPALRLGPPWWFFDSPNGLVRFLDRVVETAGIHNTVGFNDDTRALPSIPARHDLWRRVAANWVAGLVVTGQLDEDDASEMILDLAYRLPRRAYKFTKTANEPT